VQESFVKVYEDRAYRFPTVVNHGGIVVAFAMDDHRRIRYATLAMQPDDPLDVDGWPTDPAPVPFPGELVPVGFAAADPTPMPRVALGTATQAPAATVLASDDLDPVLSSTARLGAAAPFQVVSDGQFLYLFRQAVTEPTPEQLTWAAGASTAAALDMLADHAAMVYVCDATGAPVLDADGARIPLVSGRILVDRFVLVGDQLQPKREVRFQRSRNKSRPAGRTDGLGDKDLDGRPFVEPTQELRFLPPAGRGRFAVSLVPTSVAGSYRWQLVCAEEAAGVLWSYSVEKGADGLFDTLGSQAWTCADHSDVFALLAGTCTRPVGTPPVPCGKPLVAVVEQSGAAGSAVALAPGSVVRLHGAAALGTRFTVEAWAKLAADAPNGEQVLLGGGSDDAHSCPTVRIVDRTGIRVGFGDGTALRTVTAIGALTPGTWQHIAASYDGTLMTVCVSGVPVLTSTDLAEATPVSTAPASIGGSFAGIVDEIRLWSLARSADMIRAQLHVRQSGLEEGLVGYWRFDEGRGATAWDQAGAATGDVDPAGWTTSDAPIGLSRGVSRTAIRITGRIPTGGVSTAVYFQQENAVGGYDTTPKRHKGAARVMVAAVTAPEEGPADADAGRVTVLDFGLGPDGRLSDLPTAVELPVIAGPSAGGRSLSQLLDEIGDVEATQAALGSDVRSTEQLIADLTDGLAKAHRAQGGLLGADVISGACGDLHWTAVTVSQLVSLIGALAKRLPPPGAPTSAADAALLTQLTALQNQLQQPLLQLDNGINVHQQQLVDAQAQMIGLQRDLVAAQVHLAALRAEANGDVAAPMPLLHVDPDGGTVAGAVLEFATARSAPYLFDSALGTLGVYFRGAGDQLSAAYYDTFTGARASASPGRPGRSPSCRTPRWGSSTG
jgi:Concanavalin A-like lectin/glucanases superfamily